MNRFIRYRGSGRGANGPVTTRRRPQARCPPHRRGTVCAWPRASASRSRTSRRRRASRRPRCPTPCAACRPPRRRRSACAPPPTSSATPATRSPARSPAAAPASSACSPARSRTSASSASSSRSGASSAATICRWCSSTPRASPSARSGCSPASSPTSSSTASWSRRSIPPTRRGRRSATMLPIVTVGDALAGPTVGEVLFDNRAGVHLVLEHLHALGHRRIAVMTPSRPSTPDRPAERVVAEVCARARARRDRGQRPPLDRRRRRGRRPRPAALRAAADRGVLPLGLDRLRRLRRGRGARARRSPATSRSPATTAIRSRAWSRRR